MNPDPYWIYYLWNGALSCNPSWQCCVDCVVIVSFQGTSDRCIFLGQISRRLLWLRECRLSEPGRTPAKDTCVNVSYKHSITDSIREMFWDGLLLYWFIAVKPDFTWDTIYITLCEFVYTLYVLYIHCLHCIYIVCTFNMCVLYIQCV